MDTNADYMSIICEYVVKSNNDIYEEIQNEYEKFKKEPEFVNDGFDAGVWAGDYIPKMDVNQKYKLFAKYGLVNILKSQAEVADNEGYKSIDEYLKAGEDVEFSMAFYILITEVLI